MLKIIDEKGFHIKISSKNTFLNFLLENTNNPSWSELEWQYYKFLVLTIGKNSNLTILEDLNHDFEIAQNKLTDYLEKVSSKKPKSLPLMHDLLLNHSTPLELDKTIFINFNYTNTVSTYFNDPNIHKDIVVNIHGLIFGIKSEIIFGYGDETIKGYN
ncbi:MAG: hypothetical protein ACI8SE_000206 [Bacteroidia bacterium]